MRHPAKHNKVILARCQLRPGDFDSLILHKPLKIGEQRLLIADLAWAFLLRQGKSRKQARRLANVPFHRMQPVTAIGDVRDARFLQPGGRFSTLCGMSAPSGIWKGRELTSI